MMNKSYSKIPTISCLFVLMLLSGCNNPNVPQARVADNVRGFIDSRLPIEEQEVMSNVLASLPSELRSAETIVYADSNGKLHSNKLEIVNEINQGLMSNSVDPNAPSPSMGLEPSKDVLGKK